jgi:hypothetical protein
MALSSREIYWSAIIADFRRSGLTHVEFCQLRDIPIHSFRKWLYRPRPGSPKAAPAGTEHSLPRAPVPTRPVPAAFLQVHVRPAHTPTDGDGRGTPAEAPLELVLGKDRRLRIPVGFDPATLRQLLNILEERP